MSHSFARLALVCVWAAVSPLAGTRAAPTSCESLASLSLPESEITLAESVTDGTFTPPADPARGGAKSITNLPSFCRVAATLTLSADSDVKIEVWMPLGGWNGKYVGRGNGGYAGSINYGVLASGVMLGYATANTDMGTAPSSTTDPSRVVGRPVKWLDFGYRSTHAMTVIAKQIIEAFYGKSPRYSYFTGCSTGGMQGLREAQQFPDDYDGILAGDPGNNRTRLHVSIFWNYVVPRKNPASSIPDDKLQLIHRSALDACNTAHGGVKTDTFLSDPRDCRWSPETLLCKSDDTASCLTLDQVSVVEKLYAGPVNPRTHEQLFPGLVRGSELGWTPYMALATSSELPYAGVFQWVFGPTWDWKTFDFDRDVMTFDAVLAPIFNATSPDLNRFRGQGHKLVMYEGWEDWLSAPQDAIDYYDAVVHHLQRGTNPKESREASQTVQQFYRLFMLPGVRHCSGGPGPDSFDGLGALAQWVEHGIAPNQIVASHSTNGAVDSSRPLCPYPQIAKYKGAGNIDDATSFLCVNEGSQPNADQADILARRK